MKLLNVVVESVVLTIFLNKAFISAFPSKDASDTQLWIYLSYLAQQTVRL